MKNILALVGLCLLGVQLQAQVSFTLSSSPGVGTGPSYVSVADVNGDGKPDLVIANHLNTISVLTNNGSGGFVLSSPPPSTSGDLSTALAVDVNGDGKPDLVTAGYYNDTVYVMTNNGSGGFVLSSTAGVGTYPIGMAAADLNGDGKVDLITGNSADNSVTVLTNNGSGGFATSGTYAVGDALWCVIAADVNGDGKLDLITANYGDSTLSVLTNNGSGGFATSGTYAVGTNPRNVVAADVNGDGKVDLICANYNANTITVLTNNGTGGFVTSAVYTVGSNPDSIAAVDVNGDGAVDLVVANYGANTLSILTNNGTGGFVSAGTFATGSNPYAVAAADVNGDGKVDLIVANYGANTLSILTNGTPFLPPTAPIITTQPVGQTNLLGASPWFNVMAKARIGLQQFSYQWRFDGTNLPAATNDDLTLPDLTLSQAGIYDVIVTNISGSVTSQPAILEVNFLYVTLNGQIAIGTATAVASASVALQGGYPGGYLFYTLDGSIPTTSSTLYAGPFTLTSTATVWAMGISSDFSQSSAAPPVLVQIVPTYNLETSVNGSGVVSASPASGPYVSNSIVQLTATANQYWAFAYWQGDAAGTQNPLNVTMNGARNIQAVFVQTAYPLTAGTAGGGSVTVNGQSIAPATYYTNGSVVSIAATASSSCSFLGWQGTATGTSNPLYQTINNTNNIQAVFGTVVNTNAVGGGGIVMSLPNPVPFLSALTVSAVPDAGNCFVAWGGAASGTNTPATFLVSATNLTADALFAVLPGGKYSLSATVLGNGRVTISPQQNYYSAGATVTLQASTTNAGTSFFGWSGDATGTNTSLLVTMNSSKVIQANFSAPLTVSITPPTLIVFGGSNAVLNANASGQLPLAFQWQDSEGIISGATNATYTIFDAQATNTDTYTVIVSNTSGSVTSAVATVTVVFPPSISSPPASQTVAEGNSLVLTASASGTIPLNYQWQNSSGAIPGQTNSSLVLNPALTNYTDNYSVIVSNSYGAVTSQVATVFVYLPVSISSQPASLVVPYSAPATFGVCAYGFPSPTSYQWIFNGTNLPGATSSTLAINNVRLANTGTYQVLVGNGYSFTNSRVVALNIAPTLVTPFSGATTFWGGNATLTVGAYGSGQLTYQWYVNGVAIEGATLPSLNFPSIQFTNGGLYSVVVSSPFGSATNTPEQVVVNPAGVSLGFYPGLTISGVPGYSYIIQSSTDLADTNSWLTQTNLILSFPVQLWIDTSVDASSPFNPQTFYKILPGQ